MDYPGRGLASERVTAGRFNEREALAHSLAASTSSFEYTWISPGTIQPMNLMASSTQSLSVTKAIYSQAPQWEMPSLVSCHMAPPLYPSNRSPST